MTQAQLPLYPKISSIYNKILQLAIAVVFIVIMLNVSLDNRVENQMVISDHFSEYGDNYLAQAAETAQLLMSSGSKSQLVTFVESLTVPSFVDGAFLYDDTGQLIAQSGQNVTVNALFGADGHSIDQSDKLHTFVREVRGKKLRGYLRLTMAKKPLVSELNQASQNSQELSRVMLIMAGCVGFFLTRGLSRFSRQGYRVGVRSKS